jgi:hypothetical protein
MVSFDPIQKLTKSVRSFTPLREEIASVEINDISAERHLVFKFIANFVFIQHKTVELIVLSSMKIFRFHKISNIYMNKSCMAEQRFEKKIVSALHST